MHAIAFAFEAAKPTADAFVFAVAFDHHRLLFVGQLAPRFFGRDFFSFTEIEQPAGAPGAIDPGPDGPLTKRFARVGKHQIEIDVDYAAEATAGLAGAERAVERKEIGHRIAVGDVAVRAVQMIAEGFAAPLFLRQK